MRITPIHDFATPLRILELETWNLDHLKAYEISKLFKKGIFEVPKIALPSGENVTFCTAKLTILQNWQYLAKPLLGLLCFVE